MKLFISILTLLFAQQVIAQKPDTIWYNNKWEKTTQVSDRHYSRVIKNLAKNSFLVRDFYETGAKQMEGIFTALDPDIKNGEFSYWYRSGKKQMDATYENNKQIKVCQYNEVGDITNEWERITSIKIKDGKPVTEYLVIERTPKFPGGKEALHKFIKENMLYGQDGIKGQVVVRFEVNENGKVSNPVIIKSLSPEHDREVLAMMKKMPKWEPGKQDGKYIIVTQTLPIAFD